MNKYLIIGIFICTVICAVALIPMACKTINDNVIEPINKAQQLAQIRREIGERKKEGLQERLNKYDEDYRKYKEEVARNIEMSETTREELQKIKEETDKQIDIMLKQYHKEMLNKSWWKQFNS